MSMNLLQDLILTSPLPWAKNATMPPRNKSESPPCKHGISNRPPPSSVYLMLIAVISRRCDVLWAGSGSSFFEDENS